MIVSSRCARHTPQVAVSVLLLCVLVTAVSLLPGVASAQRRQAPNAAGSAAREINPANRGVISGVGIESRDIISMSDQMVRDLMSVPQLAGRATPPRIIVDDQFFRNDSTQRINKAMITDRLRVGLNRAAAGRMAFVGREYAAMVEQERALKREGVTDVGTTGMTKATAGIDYRLTGKITSLDQTQASTGMVQRWNQILFEMQDMETNITVWSNIYDFERAAADDVVYR